MSNTNYKIHEDNEDLKAQIEDLKGQVEDLKAQCNFMWTVDVVDADHNHYEEFQPPENMSEENARALFETMRQRNDLPAGASVKLIEELADFDPDLQDCDHNVHDTFIVMQIWQPGRWQIAMRVYEDEDSSGECHPIFDDISEQDAKRIYNKILTEWKTMPEMEGVCVEDGEQVSVELVEYCDEGQGKHGLNYTYTIHEEHDHLGSIHLWIRRQPGYLCS
jgi:hypothetical protein